MGLEFDMYDLNQWSRTTDAIWSLLHTFILLVSWYGAYITHNATLNTSNIDEGGTTVISEFKPPGFIPSQSFRLQHFAHMSRCPPEKLCTWGGVCWLWEIKSVVWMQTQPIVWITGHALLQTSLNSCPLVVSFYVFHSLWANKLCAFFKGLGWLYASRELKISWRSQMVHFAPPSNHTEVFPLTLCWQNCYYKQFKCCCLYTSFLTGRYKCWHFSKK